MSVEVFETRPQWPIHVMILPREAVLSTVSQWVEFVAPVAVEVEPLGRRGGAECGCSEGVVGVIVCIRVRVQTGIPKRSAIGFVVEQTPWQDIVVDSGGGVHCMTAFGGIDDWL